MEEPMPYDKFVEFANDHGLKDVTKDEYDTLVAGTTFSAVIQLRRIRNSRSKGSKKMEHEPIVAYSLGGRTNRFDENTQWVSFLKADGTFADYKHRGSWTGKHGRRHKLDIEISEGISKKTGKPWMARDIKAVTVLEDKLKPERHIQFLIPDELKFIMNVELEKCKKANGTCPHKDQRHYPTVAVKGEIAEIMPQGEFEQGSDGKWKKVRDLPTNDHETLPYCSIIFKGDEVKAAAHFGPWKGSKAEPFLLHMDGFNNQDCPSAEILDLTFTGMTVGVVGNFTRLKKEVLDSGDNYYYANLECTAIFGLDEDPGVVTVAAAPEESSVGAVANNDPATTARVTALKKLIRTQLQDAPAIEAPDLLKLEEVQKMFQGGEAEQVKLTVEIALKKVREEGGPSNGGNDQTGGDGDRTLTILKAKLLDLVRERTWCDPDDLRRNFWQKEYAGRKVTAMDISMAVEQLASEGKIKEEAAGFELASPSFG